jgi:60 kDa SS-A/Ro ribonucleoprotein
MKYPGLSVPTQSEPLDERQVENSAGGYVFQVDDFTRLQRFLVLGSDKPTYYASARKLTVENAGCATRCWAESPSRTAGMLADLRNRVPKLDPMIFVLALGFAHKEVAARQAAERVFPAIITNASQLFSFMAVVMKMRGTGRILRRALRDWYESRDAETLAYQMIKYRERQGYDHRKVLEVSHPRVTVSTKSGQIESVDQLKGALFRRVRQRDAGHDFSYLPDRGHEGLLPPQYRAFETAQHADIEKICELIQEYRLPWEAIPNDRLRHPKVQRALIPNMPLGAFLRQLGLLSKIGVLDRGDMEKFKDLEAVRRSKLHPYQVLTALATYRDGRGMRSDWPVHGFVLEALNDLFYAAFQNVEPTGKRIMLALDVSDSMGCAHIQGDALTAREASGAMAMVTLRREAYCDVVAFRRSLQPLPLHARMSLEEVVLSLNCMDFGGTDCSQPMLYASEHGREYDAFVIYTDNETWAGHQHPVQALRDYRRRFVKDAKLIVVGMTSTGFSIADPEDPRMLDVVGFDSAAPGLIADFMR